MLRPKKNVWAEKCVGRALVCDSVRHSHHMPSCCWCNSAGTRDKEVDKDGCCALERTQGKDFPREELFRCAQCELYSSRTCTDLLANNAIAWQAAHPLEEWILTPIEDKGCAVWLAVKEHGWKDPSNPRYTAITIGSHGATY